MCILAFSACELAIAVFSKGCVEGVSLLLPFCLSVGKAWPALRRDAVPCAI